jgi:assimilatory nitrate reductase catalytic subunit
MTYAKIQSNNGLFWPCNAAHPEGTPRLFLERFFTPDGRARFYPAEYRGPAEEPNHEYPLYLTTGRMVGHYQSGAQTRRVPELNAAQPAAFVEVHPDTARSLQIEDGTLVHVVTRRGRVTCQARHSRAIRLDTLFMPFHFAGEGRANTLTNDAVDAVSKIPEFKIAAARLQLATEARDASADK